MALSIRRRVSGIFISNPIPLPNNNQPKKLKMDDSLLIFIGKRKKLVFHLLELQTHLKILF
jgi:hypothetical protein